MIIERAEKLYSELNSQLKFISHEHSSALRRAEFSIPVCEEALQKLYTLFKQSKFKSAGNEIRFFKEIKPKFYVPFIFNIQLLKIESSRPINSNSHIAFLEQQLSIHEKYLQDNNEFYKYVITNSSSLDDKYFIRNKLDLHLVIDEYFLNIDRNFTTYYDIKMARIKATIDISNYLNAQLKLPSQDLANQNKSSFNLNWSDSKVALTELIYALHSAGSFNHGKIELKQLAESLSAAFNIDLGDFYRTWSEIKIRKDSTKFLDTLKMVLENKIKSDME